MLYKIGHWSYKAAKSNWNILAKQKFTGDGKPLGDRELMLKKKRTSTSDLSSPDEAKDFEEDGDLGNGLFDRFSSARKTLTRSSLRLE